MCLVKNKYIICALLGFFLKLFDDLDELFFYKNERVIECVKTTFIIVSCYYLFVAATNKYDILWLLFSCGFLPLIDWYAYTGVPFFFSLVILIPLICLLNIFLNCYTFKIKYIILSFILYCICSPITEICCWEFNGPIFELFKKNNIIDDKKVNIFSGLSKTEIEVSKKKIYTRITSIIFLSIVIVILNYFIKNSNNTEIQDLLLSVIQLCIFNISYFVLSLIHQCYVVYFDNSFIELHKKINNEDEKEQQKEDEKEKQKEEQKEDEKEQQKEDK